VYRFTLIRAPRTRAWGACQAALSSVSLPCTPVRVYNTDSMAQTSPHTFRFAVVVAACTLLLLINGALVTTQAGLTPPPAGSAAPAEPPALSLFEHAHPWLGGVAALLIFALWIWMRHADTPKGPERLGFVLTVLVAYAAQNGSSLTVPAQAWRGTLHACLAQLVFAGVVAILVLTSAAWQRGPDLVEDYGWPSLRSFSITTPALVLLQVFLGAALRHKAMGALSHLGWAMVTALWILLECVFLIQQFPEHRILRPAANWFLAVVCAQVFLGIGAFTMRTMEMDGAPALAAVTAAHVAMGAMTLAMSVVMSIHIRRNVMPKGSLSAAPISPKA
jgi:cytochrome c oxidase assembly protein subunit 15